LPPLEALVDEAARQFSVCNACRYCEDYCAVFPAIERRRLFTEGDLGYIANLCHDCRACYQACMYVDPHEFDLDLPGLLAESRVASYERYARPRRLARLLESGPLVLSVVTAAMVAIVLAIMLAAGSLGRLLDVRTGAGAFYALVPHVAMASAALVVTGLAGAVGFAGFMAFIRDGDQSRLGPLRLRLWMTAWAEALTLRWQRGGGDECYYPNADRPSAGRRRLHQLLVAGVLATFASTLSAFVYETFLDRTPPFGWLSVPVELGFWGGVAMLVGATGLGALKVRGQTATQQGRSLDTTFLVALILVAATGLALLALRATGAMGTLLVVHLASVLALLLTAPYGKLVHAVYRLAAIYRDASERVGD
jgi:citrate/tricarballylate utilization protein